MHHPIARLALLCVLAVLLAGCFDVETEVVILPDGSGFVTVWTRLSTRVVAIASALANSSPEADKKELLQNLDRLFADQPGVQLVERGFLTEGDDQVLRYRYMFENAKLAFAIYQAKIDWTRTGQDCDARYTANLEFAPRAETEIYDLRGTVFADQPPAVQRLLIDEFYRGHFRARLALPGENHGTDPSMIDTAGFPMWETTVIDLYRRGWKIQSSSHFTCPAGQARPLQPGETYPAPSLSMTVGPHATLAEVLRTFADLGDLVHLEIDVQVHRRSEIKITYRIDPRVSEPVRNLLLLPFVTMPTLAHDWDVSSQQEESGFYVFQIKTKRPMRFDETDSPFLFAGLDHDRYVFRMRLPQLSFAGARPPETAGRVQLKAHVKMPGPIRTSNATIVHDDTADWTLTSRDLLQPVTLEAICDD